MQAITGLADKVGLGGALSSAMDAVGGALKGQLESAVEKTLEALGPKAGEMAYEQMGEKYPAIKKLGDSAKDTAIDSAAKAVMSFKQQVLDFAQSVVTKPQETLKKVGVILLRACRKACNDAVDALMDSLGTCGKCVANQFGSVPDIKKQVTEVVQTAMKEKVVSSLKDKGAPAMITDKIEWGNEDDDIGEPDSKAAPQQEEMA